MKNRPSACAPRLKVLLKMMSTRPRASEASPRLRHSASCLLQQLVLHYHGVELLQLEQEKKPLKISVKTYFNLFRTTAIDRLSHALQERESTISQFLQNFAVRPKLRHNSATATGLNEVRTQRNFCQYGGRSRNKMALRFAYGQLDGHLDWLHFDTSGSQNDCTCLALCIDMIPSDPEVSKCNQSRWPSNCTGFHGHHVMRKESVDSWANLCSFFFFLSPGCKACAPLSCPNVSWCLQWMHSTASSFNKGFLSRPIPPPPPPP